MKAIEATIRAAFPEQPVPTAFFAATEGPGQDMQEELGSRVRGRVWTSVSLLDWRMVGDVPSFKRCLEPETFAYYAPSLLMGSLSEPAFLEFGLEAILPFNKRREPRGEWWGRFAAAVTDPQRAAIRDYLVLQRQSAHAGDLAAEELIGVAEALWAQSSASA